MLRAALASGDSRARLDLSRLTVLVVLAGWLPPLHAQEHEAPAALASLPAGCAREWQRKRALFTENEGQWDHPARFVAAVDGSTWLVDETGILCAAQHVIDPGFDPRRSITAHGRSWVPPTVEWRTVRIEIAGPRRWGTLQGCGEEPGPAYLVGKRERWVEQSRCYASLRFGELYPGIDATLGVVDGSMKFDLELQPGSRLEDVELRVQGADAIACGDDGCLRLRAGEDEFRFDAIVAYGLSVDGRRELLACSYDLRGNQTFGFSCPKWKGQSTLVVDPGLEWGTYFGGSDSDIIFDVEWGSDGTLYVAGDTHSADLPTTPGAWRSSGPLRTDSFLARFDPRQPRSGQLLDCTYFGGTDHEFAGALHVLSTGVVAVGGWTSSQDYPTTSGAFDPSFNGGSFHAWPSDAYVTVFDLRLTGSRQITYSTYVGGAGDEFLFSIGALRDGAIVISGDTDSGNYPVSLSPLLGSLQGPVDGFLTILDPAQQGSSQLRFSTYVGGNGYDAVRSLITNHDGTIALTGDTDSTTFPTTPGAAFPSGAMGSDAFVMKIDPSASRGQQVLFSTYLGGQGEDLPFCVGVGSGGSIFVGGRTGSFDFPTTPGASDPTLDGLEAGFLSIFDPARSGAAQLVYSTLIDGLGEEEVRELSVDRTGIADLIGNTNSLDFPRTRGSLSGPTANQYGGAFVMRLDPVQRSWRQILYSTYLVGNSADWCWSGARDDRWRVAMGGRTSSYNFPVTSNAWSSTYRGGANDGFVSVLDMLPTGVRAFGSSSSGCAGQSALTVNALPYIGNGAFEIWSVATPPSSWGALLLGEHALSAPLSLFGTELFVDASRQAFALFGTTSDSRGVAISAIPIPNQALLVGRRLYAQSFWAEASGPSPCPLHGLSSTFALEIILQP